jgi:hypothetical protein
MTKPVGNGRERYTSHSFKFAREAMSKWMTENRSGENNHWYGVKGKDNIHFGRKRSKETRDRISEKAKQRYKATKHHSAKVVICIETGEKFKSISEAKIKHKKGNINYALSSGGTAGGFHFRYETKDIEAKLKGYAAGARHKFSRVVINELGEKFDSAADAAKSISVSSTAVSIAIKQKRKCKGVMFSYEQA